MARQAPWRNQDRVETQLQFGIFGMRGKPGLRRIDDARLLPGRYRERGIIERGAGLDLDKGEQVASLDDQIDLAMGRAEPLGEDAVALGEQESGGAAFRGDAGLERGHAFGRGLPRRAAVSLRHGDAYP